MIKIETERLVLKKLVDADKERLVSLIGDFRVSKTLSKVPYPYTLDDADEWLKIVDNEEFNLNIFLNDDLIGGIGLTPTEDDFYELGYWLGVEYWGQGYATESVMELLNYAKSNTPCEKFKANAFKENVASAKVLEKNGFKRVEDREVFSISRQENVLSVNYEYC
ncbi:MAG: GNAT family N-acetyltransferase [Acidimicrobiales bacterium]|nr:GNAT family N-acetyltransferase [Acidimicrobiales bacterium]